jgi:hypothetical protein
MELPEEKIRFWSRISCGTCIVISLFFFVNAYTGISQFEKMFKEMELGTLPLSTTLVFKYRIDLIVGFIAVAALAKEFAMKNPVKTMNLNFILTAVVLCLKEFYSFAMFQPMVEIMEKIGR